MVPSIASLDRIVSRVDRSSPGARALTGCGTTFPHTRIRTDRGSLDTRILATGIQGAQRVAYPEGRVPSPLAGKSSREIDYDWRDERTRVRGTRGW